MTFVPYWLCGFEVGHKDVVGLYVTGTHTVRTATPAPHTGAYYLSIYSGRFRISLDDLGASEAYIACANYAGASSTGNAAIGFVPEGASYYVGIRWNSTTACWDAYVNNAKVASGTIPVSITAWAHLQLRVIIGGAGVGVIQSKIDGVTDIDFLGATNTGADSDAIMEATFESAASRYAYYDDCAIGTGGWPGAIRADALMIPKADTARADLEPSTGSAHYVLVDEVPPSDADYVSLETDFNVTITGGSETLSVAMQSGELFAANGGAVPAVGTRFRVGGTGDFSSWEMTMAKRSDPADGDVFIVTSNTSGSEAISYCRREDRYTIGTWDGTGKIPVAVVGWLRRSKDSAVDHKSEILFYYDGSSSYGTPESMSTTASYQSRIIQELPGGSELAESRINATQLGVRFTTQD